MGAALAVGVAEVVEAGNVVAGAVVGGLMVGLVVGSAVGAVLAGAVVGGLVVGAVVGGLVTGAAVGVVAGFFVGTVVGGFVAGAVVPGFVAGFVAGFVLAGLSGGVVAGFVVGLALGDAKSTFLPSPILFASTSLAALTDAFPSLASFAAFSSAAANAGMVKYVDELLTWLGECRMVPTEGFKALIILPLPI